MSSNVDVEIDHTPVQWNGHTLSVKLSGDRYLALYMDGVKASPHITFGSFDSPCEFEITQCTQGPSLRIDSMGVFDELHRSIVTLVESVSWHRRERKRIQASPPYIAYYGHLTSVNNGVVIIRADERVYVYQSPSENIATIHYTVTDAIETHNTLEGRAHPVPCILTTRLQAMQQELDEARASAERATAAVDGLKDALNALREWMQNKEQNQK